MAMRAWVLLSVLLLAGCATPESSRDDDPDGGSDGGPGDGGGTGAPGGSDSSTFPSGIVWRDPASDRLTGPDGAPSGLGIPPGGFDLQGDVLVFAVGQEVVVQEPSGRETLVRVEGIRDLARASLSPDATRVVVQAIDPERQGGAMENLDIFVVTLADGSWRRISDRPVNEESPEWSPAGDRIAYSSFDPDVGITLHVVDPDGAPVLDVEDGGGIHLAWSRDGNRILEPGRMLLFDAGTGGLVADLHDEAVAGLEAAGYVLETRYEGQAGRGTFPLDGAFSPDGRTLVFDGAVGGAEPRVVVATLSVDGTGFEVVGGPVPVDPSVTNGLNYSELNPLWR